MGDLYPIVILVGFTGIIFGLGMILENRIHKGRDPYINSVNAELRRRNATRKARRKVIKWKDI